MQKAFVDGVSSFAGAAIAYLAMLLLMLLKDLFARYRKGNGNTFWLFYLWLSIEQPI